MSFQPLCSKPRDNPPNHLTIKHGLLEISPLVVFPDKFPFIVDLPISPQGVPFNTPR